MQNKISYFNYLHHGACKFVSYSDVYALVLRKYANAIKSELSYEALSYWDQPGLVVRPSVACFTVLRKLFAVFFFFLEQWVKFSVQKSLKRRMPVELNDTGRVVHASSKCFTRGRHAKYKIKCALDNVSDSYAPMWESSSRTAVSSDGT